LAFGFVLVSMSLASCASDPRVLVPAGRVAVPAPVSENGSSVDAESLTSGLDSAQPSAVESAASRISIIRDQPREFVAPKAPNLGDKFSDKDRISVAVEAMPVRSFVNHVFGELLKVSYVVVEGSSGLEAPVSLASPDSISSRRLFALASELLSSNGLSVVEKEGVYFIGPTDAKTGSGMSLGYGRNPADVPTQSGVILQLVPLKFGLNPTLQRTFRELSAAQVIFDSRQQALFVTGSRESVLRVLDLVGLFDQPAAKASRVGMIRLTYLSPTEFIAEVTKLLANDGILVNDETPLTLVPLDRMGSVVVFASEDAVLERLDFWAKQIDRAGEGPTGRYFVYQPRFARASDLGASIASLIGGSASTQDSEARDTRSAIATGSSVATPQTAMRRDAASGRSSTMASTTVSANGITLTIDSLSNSLIFFTSGPRYEALLPLIKRLDVPPKQVLLEATVAEVSLTGEFAKGVEFAFLEGKFSGSTLGALGLPSGGFGVTFLEGVAGQIRARLQESDSKVNVLSSPILLVRDGFPATISVGNDVPTVGATASDPLVSDKTVTTVLYRKTGLQLTITPTINAEGSVVMAISQQISSTVPGSSGVQGAPIFFERAVSTEVVAGSGQSVLLAGLISESGTDSAEKVPVLGRIPALGGLFSSTSKRREKTELVLFITPRVVNSGAEWATLYEKINESFKYLQMPTIDSAEPRSSNIGVGAEKPLQ
jgi:general secretion pathway protein D